MSRIVAYCAAVGTVHEASGIILYSTLYCACFEEEETRIHVWLERVGSFVIDKSGICRKSKLTSRFLQRLCLRQNQITRINFPTELAETLTELDLYDNLISHVKGLDEFHNLTSLDLSFNKIKHIKNVEHLKKLTDIYFVQNKISRIEGLEGLDKLRNLELGANRIRVCEEMVEGDMEVQD